LDQAENNPEVALAYGDNNMQRVKCPLWNGTERELHISDPEIAKECRDTFGWEVQPEDGPAYKYSKSLNNSSDLSPLFKWICPPDMTKTITPSHMRAATLSSGGTDKDNRSGIAYWKTFTIQRGRKLTHFQMTVYGHTNITRSLVANETAENTPGGSPGDTAYRHRESASAKGRSRTPFAVCAHRKTWTNGRTEGLAREKRKDAPG